MKSIRSKLALASCTLLTHGVQAADGYSDWGTGASYMRYSEADDRVTVDKLVGTVGTELSDNASVQVDVIYDTMSGATPTGAVQQSSIAAVTTPSSGGSALGTSGGTAALSTFSDTRVALDVDWEQYFSRLFKANFGGSVSVESDYESYGVSINVSQDSSNRMTSYTAGVAYTWDTIYQTGGGTPDPLGDVEDGNFFGKGDRSTWDAIVGITRILNRRTIAQLNYYHGQSSGYHTDPYKVISRVDENDIEMERYFESRPDSRARNAVYTAMAHQLAGDKQVIHLSYRYYWDDWDVKSHTLDMKYRWDLSSDSYLRPRLRLYNQTAAKFFYHGISRTVDIDSLEYASADPRLDDMSSATLGLKYGKELPKNSDLGVRMEYYYQTFEEAEFDTNKAYIIQLSYQKAFR